MKTTLTPKGIAPVIDLLAQANAQIAKRYPGEASRRQPVSTVYGGAHVFKADSAPKLGALALRALREYAPNWAVLAHAIGLHGSDRWPELPENPRI